MNKTIRTAIFFISLFYITHASELHPFEINPNDQSSFPKEEISEVEKKSNETTEAIIGSSAPILSFITTGYLTISSIKNVIIYPFSAKEITINVFYKNGYLLMKDNNEMIIWNYKFDLKEKEEIKALTFINRGTLFLKDSSNERIWPFIEEKMNKKININFKQGNLEVTNEQNENLWNYSVNKDKGKKLENKHLKTQLEYLAI